MNNTEASISKTSLEMKNLGEETEDTGEKAKKASKDGFTVLRVFFRIYTVKPLVPR
jgi:hypothetical protein